jgi:small subunit ribosomal protein S21
VLNRPSPCGPDATRVGLYFIRRDVRTIVQIVIRNNDIEQGLRVLKKKLQREGVYRELKRRKHYEKPSEVKARETNEAVRRQRKLERKRKEREGF